MFSPENNNNPHSQSMSTDKRSSPVAGMQCHAAPAVGAAASSAPCLCSAG